MSLTYLITTTFENKALYKYLYYCKKLYKYLKKIHDLRLFFANKNLLIKKVLILVIFKPDQNRRSIHTD